MHPVVTHGDPVRDGHRAEDQREAVRPAYPVLRPLRQSVEGHVARGDLVPAAGDTDLRFAPVVVPHPYCAEHAARPGTLDTVGDNRAVWLAMLTRSVAHDL